GVSRAPGEAVLHPAAAVAPADVLAVGELSRGRALLVSALPGEPAARGVPARRHAGAHRLPRALEETLGRAAVGGELDDHAVADVQRAEDVVVAVEAAEVAE